MTWLYGSAILLGSLLLFLVQPMCAKMLLPLLGGTPAAWNTCMVFFQSGLLAGYAYAHLLPRWIGVRHQAIWHLILLLVAFTLLPVRLPDEIPDGWHPVLWLLASLTWSVGLPFVMLAAAGAPLLQGWFASRSARDPYFLYAASNLGSFLALGLFPFVLEPNVTLTEQSDVWRYGFLAMIVLLAVCVPWSAGSPLPSGGEGLGVRGYRQRQRMSHSRRLRKTWSLPLAQPPHPRPRVPGGERGEIPPGESVAAGSRWRLPSSLLLSVTTHATTDIAAIPLLWLIPMGLYLLTFTIVFAQQSILPHAVIVRWLPLAAIVLLITLLSEANEPMPLVLAVNLICFFWLAMGCHGELARTRPGPEHLTDFYLCLALGGVLGGVLNALLAPLIFPGLYEYPLMIVLACAFVPAGGLQPTKQDWLWALGVGAASAFILLAAAQVLAFGIAGLGASLLLCYLLHKQPARFALCLAAVVLASGLDPGVNGAVIDRARSYFGIHRVTRLADMHRLVHGNTVHGQQNVHKPEEPLTYYSTTGPIGDVFRNYHGDPRLKQVGVVGLGAGSLAAYVEHGQSWTYFEIDPTVKRIAEDPKLFTYLRDARERGSVRIELGDARLQLKKSSQRFGLLIIDAFGSDAIPLHLLTREALAIDLEHLEPNGLLAFHISNRYVDLEPVLANLAADADPPCSAFIRRHGVLTDEMRDQGIMPSDWLVMARSEADVQPLLKSPGWRPARGRPEWKAWTDDYSNLFQVFQWRSAAGKE